MTQIKICGLREKVHVETAVNAGARYLGFNFFPKSPRAVSAAQAAELGTDLPVGIARVGLFVNPDDAYLDAILNEALIDIIQLHGSETVARITEIKSRFGLPVIKAVGIAGAQDLPQLTDYSLAADMVLVDAKPQAGSQLPGGNGLAFDWNLLAGRRWLKPWMLAGGLTSANVAEAVRLTRAPIVDVSSGVESKPGQKDNGLIRDFAAAVAGSDD